MILYKLYLQYLIARSREESNFQYLFGVKEPGCFAALRVRDAHAVLLIPRMDQVYEAWCGPVKPPAWFAKAYGLQAAHGDELREVLERLGAKELLVLQGDANRDSGLRLPEVKFQGQARVIWPVKEVCWLVMF